MITAMDKYRIKARLRKGKIDIKKNVQNFFGWIKGAELIELKESLKERLKKYEHYDAEKERLTLQIIKQEQKAKVIAKRISKSRKNSIENLQKEMASISPRRNPIPNIRLAII